MGNIGDNPASKIYFLLEGSFEVCKKAKITRTLDRDLISYEVIKESKHNELFFEFINKSKGLLEMENIQKD